MIDCGFMETEFEGLFDPTDSGTVFPPVEEGVCPLAQSNRPMKKALN